jgi:oxalate decarboxylase/phosphoglucose isomerase-like protein (cupin superfamily)
MKERDIFEAVVIVFATNRVIYFPKMYIHYSIMYSIVALNKPIKINVFV